jgi:hypothetical protein
MRGGQATRNTKGENIFAYWHQELKTQSRFWSSWSTGEIRLMVERLASVAFSHI